MGWSKPDWVGTVTMNAQEVVDSIGEGVAEALAISGLLLGIEAYASQNADIHPEYVTTVEVAKRLTGPERQVSLEAHMKELRQQARTLSWIASGRNKGVLAGVDIKLASFKFGKKDSRRLDILVRQSDAPQPPLLIVEAKLGVRNLKGVKKDVDRIVRLLDMYEALGLLAKHTVYGAAVFHSMEEGNATGVANARTQAFLQDVQTHLGSLKTTRPWLNAEAGLPQRGTMKQPVVGYTEQYDDGTLEDVFAKNCYHFVPGLALLGNAGDVATVQF